jgi:hypothetical protein
MGMNARRRYWQLAIYSLEHRTLGGSQTGPMRRKEFEHEIVGGEDDIGALAQALEARCGQSVSVTDGAHRRQPTRAVWL